MKHKESSKLGIYTGQTLSYLVSAALGDLVISVFLIFLPLLTLKIGGNLLEAGLVGGLASVTYGFLPFVMGRFSDRIRSKHLFLAVSFGIITTVSFVYVFATLPIELIVARTIEGIGWAMLWPSIQSGLLKVSSDKRKILSVYNSVWSAAYATSPIIAGALVTIASIRYVFYFTTIVLILGVAVNLVFAYSDSSNKSNVLQTEDNQYVPQINTSTDQEIPHLEKRVSKTFCFLAVLVGALSVAILLTFFPPVGTSLGISVFVIGIITAGYGFARCLFFIFAANKKFSSRVLNRRHQDRFIILMLVIIALSSASLLVGDRAGALSFAAFVVVGASYSMMCTISQYNLVANAPLERSGAYAGVFESAIGIGTFVGPTLAGVVAQYNIISPFLLSGVGVFAFVVVYSSLLRKK